MLPRKSAKLNPVGTRTANGLVTATVPITKVMKKVIKKAITTAQRTATTKPTTAPTRKATKKVIAQVCTTTHPLLIMISSTEVKLRAHQAILKKQKRSPGFTPIMLAY